MLIWLQEVAAQAEQALAALKAERRKLQAAEKQLKAMAESRSEATVQAAAVAEELALSKAETERFKRLSEERASLVVQAENAAVETSQQCDAQVRSIKCALSCMRGCLSKLDSDNLGGGLIACGVAA